MPVSPSNQDRGIPLVDSHVNKGILDSPFNHPPSYFDIKNCKLILSSFIKKDNLIKTVQKGGQKATMLPLLDAFRTLDLIGIREELEIWMPNLTKGGQC